MYINTYRNLTRLAIPVQTQVGQTILKRAEHTTLNRTTDATVQNKHHEAQNVYTTKLQHKKYTKVEDNFMNCNVTLPKIN